MAGLDDDSKLICVIGDEVHTGTGVSLVAGAARGCRQRRALTRPSFRLPSFGRVQDTVTGFLLAGIGQRDSKGANFLVVDASESGSAWSGRSQRATSSLHSHRLAAVATPPHARAETTRETIEKTFNSFVSREDVGLVLINQAIAESIRPVVLAHKAVIPMVIEIPGRDAAASAATDPIMKRVLQMLGEA